jgi:hypothetical protein
VNLLREGLTNEEIADRLGISFAAAKYHVSEIISKLRVSSRHEAVQCIDERKKGWLAIPLFNWRIVGGMKSAPLYLASTAALTTIVALVALTWPSGDSASEPQTTTASVGLDAVSEEEEAFRKAQQATPYKQTILFTKSAPTNVGNASGVLASLPTVNSLAMLQRVIGPETNLVVVDRSAMPELQDSSFLEELHSAGIAVMGLNICMVDLSNPARPATTGPAFEISPTGEIRYFNTTTTPPPRGCATPFVQATIQANRPYFSFAPRTPSVEEIDAMRSRGERLTFSGGNVVRFIEQGEEAFEVALSRLNEGNFQEILPAPERCESQQADGTWQTVPCP